MYEYKIKRCPRSKPHDWTICPYAHPGEKAKRRDPRKYQYSARSVPCLIGERVRRLSLLLTGPLTPASPPQVMPAAQEDRCLPTWPAVPPGPRRVRVLAAPIKARLPLLSRPTYRSTDQLTRPYPPDTHTLAGTAPTCARMAPSASERSASSPTGQRTCATRRPRTRRLRGGWFRSLGTSRVSDSSPSDRHGALHFPGAANTASSSSSCCCC